MLLNYIILGVIGILLVVSIILFAGASSKVKQLKAEKAKTGAAGFSDAKYGSAITVPPLKSEANSVFEAKPQFDFMKKTGAEEAKPQLDFMKKTGAEEEQTQPFFAKKDTVNTEPLPELDFLKQDDDKETKPAYTNGTIAAAPNSPLLAGIKKSEPSVNASPLFNASAPAANASPLFNTPAPVANASPLFNASAPAANASPLFNTPAPAANASPLFNTPASAMQTADSNVTIGMFGASSSPVTASPVADTGKTVALYNMPKQEDDGDKTVMIAGAGRKVSYISLTAANGQKFRAAIDPEITIGRKTGQILLNFDPSISGTHCKINKFGSVYTITDMNSSNGTFVNGNQIVSPTQVKTGDRILLGRLEFTLTIEE